MAPTSIKSRDTTPKPLDNRRYSEKGPTTLSYSPIMNRAANRDLYSNNLTSNNNSNA